MLQQIYPTINCAGEYNLTGGEKGKKLKGKKKGKNKKINQRNRGEKGIEKLVKNICLRHKLVIYQGEENSTQNVRRGGEEIKP